MCKVRFGPSGNSESFYEQGYKNTEQAAEWLSKMGLSAFEYSFGRGTKISEKKALLIGEKCLSLILKFPLTLLIT